MAPPQPLPERKPASRGLLRSIRAVAWSLIGLRKGSEYQQDIENITPLQIIMVGLIAIFLLVLGLIALVNWLV